MKNNIMKSLKIIVGLTLIFSMVSCNPENSKKNISIESNKVSNRTYVTFEGNVTPQFIGEIQYKEHTYIYTIVHAGISLTHAGHCRKIH